MYKVKYGGKKGQTVELEESPNLVAVRTKDNKAMGELNLSRESREMVSDSISVAKFPEAGITVIKVDEAPVEDSGLESFSGPGEGRRELAGPPDTTKRDATRAALKQEDDIRFAGRVLQDKASGEVMLYTENFFIKFFDTITEANCLAIIEKYHLVVKNKLPFATNAYFVQASEGTGLEVFNIAEKILQEKVVEYCHPELVQERRFKGVHPLQWHLDKTSINGKPVDAHVNINGAWAITKGKGVTIAVVDDGIDVDHPEFAGRIVHPFDASLNMNDARPKTADDNHGTACAGMACASGLKDGASGTAPEAFLMPIRLRSGLGSMAEANAFAWAADHGADVISCSWGPTDGEWWNPADPVHNRVTMLPDSTRLAMDYALTKGRKGKGCVILFAAGNGNESTDNDGYVSYPGVITVAACNDTGKRSVYSDYGPQVWVSFPSGDFAWRALQHPAPLSEGLRTTDRSSKDGYSMAEYTNSFGGTSGACPGMAGVVALMLGANPALTPAQVKEIIAASCDIIDKEKGEYSTANRSEFYGYGRINAQKAVENARKKAGAAATTTPSTGTTALSITGKVRFKDAGDLNFKPTELIQAPSGTPLMGLALELTPTPKDVQLRYLINTGTELLSNKKAGEFTGITDAKKKVIGVALLLEGAGAKLYDIEYAAKVDQRKTLSKAKNGTFCGTAAKTGKSILALSITLKKKQA
jgi:subtilisin family serine protease